MDEKKEITCEQKCETLERVIAAWDKLSEFQKGQLDMMAQIALGGLPCQR